MVYHLEFAQIQRSSMGVHQNFCSDNLELVNCLTVNCLTKTFGKLFNCFSPKGSNVIGIWCSALQANQCNVIGLWFGCGCITLMDNSFSDWYILHRISTIVLTCNWNEWNEIKKIVLLIWVIRVSPLGNRGQFSSRVRQVAQNQLNTHFEQYLRHWCNVRLWNKKNQIKCRTSFS